MILGLRHTPVYSPDTGSGDGGASGSIETGATAAVETVKPTKPDGLADSFWDAEKGAVKFDDLTRTLGELTAIKETVEQRKAAVPEKPDGYKPELPKTFKAPQGIKIPELTADNPSFVKLREVAHKHGLPQEAVSDLVALKTELDLAELDAAGKAIDAEFAKLGDKAKERVSAVENWLKANASADEYPDLQQLVTKASVLGWLEKIAAKLNGGQIPTKQGETEPRKPAEQRWYPTMVKAS